MPYNTMKIVEINGFFHIVDEHDKPIRDFRNRALSGFGFKEKDTAIRKMQSHLKKKDKFSKRTLDQMSKIDVTK